MTKRILVSENYQAEKDAKMLLFMVALTEGIKLIIENEKKESEENDPI